MKLSIIIPAHNTEKYIGACIYSCVSHPDTEVIIIDDNSTDKTYDIARNYQKHYNSDSMPYAIKILKQSELDKGVSKARNGGLDYAMGDYVWFVDSDDLINPDAIKYVLARCDGKENIVRFNHFRYYKAKDTLMKRFEQPPYRIWFHERQFLWEVVWDRIYKRQFLLDHNIRFDESINFGEDQIFNLEALNANDGYLQDSHFVYVKTWNNPDSITHHLTKQMRQKNMDALKKLKTKYKDDKKMLYEIDFQIWKLKQLPSFEGVK